MPLMECLSITKMSTVFNSLQNLLYGTLGFNKAADQEFLKKSKFANVKYSPSNRVLSISADGEGPVRLNRYPGGGRYIFLVGLQKEIGWETAGTADVFHSWNGREISLNLSPLLPDSEGFFF